MKLTHIKIDPDSDGYDILFVNEERYIHGDDYHTKISYQIDGIRNFLEYIRIPFEYCYIQLQAKNNKCWEDLDYQPNFEENSDKYLKRLSKDFKIKKEIKL